MPKQVMQILFLAILSAPILYFAYIRYVGKRALLRNKLQRFFGKDPFDLQIVSRHFASVDLPNLQMAIEKVAEEAQASIEQVGYASSFGGLHNDLRSLISGTTMFDRTRVGPPQCRQVDVDVDRSMSCIENGIHLLYGHIKLAAHVRFDVMQSTTDVEIMAETAESAERFMDRIRTVISTHNVYRGKVISLEAGEAIRPNKQCVTVRFHRPPEVSREQIVLPDKTLSLIERNTLGFYRHAEALRLSGRSTKRGLLFYGKPGTGKTFTAKWLAHAYPDLTVILLSGEQLYLIKDCCQLARMLSPSLVIMEDVDLVATHRDENLHPSSQVTLHQILNEMDGMPSNTDVMFLLTTNRAEVLEPAIAARPGRIDQAIEFPLPDEHCRARLFELYSRGLQLENVDFGEFVKRTDGASPAFIQELMRKAALIAADRAPTRGPIHVAREDIDCALRELLFDGGDLTRNLLGFRVES